MQVVSIPSEASYFTIFGLTGIPDTKTILLTNNTSSVIQVVQASVPPLATSDAFPLYPLQSVLVQGIGDPVWVKGKTGPLVVQDLADTIVPFNGIDPRVYIGTQAITTQNFIEANCKNGVQYQFATYNPTFAAGAITDFIVTTGVNPILIKNRHYQFDGALITTTVYKNPTYTGGTVVPYYNMSDLNPIVGTAVIRGLPTVTNVGTQISPTVTMLGSIPQGGQSLTATDAESDIEGLERVLAPNSTYLFRTVNAGAATCRISTLSSWYEGQLSSTIP